VGLAFRAHASDHSENHEATIRADGHAVADHRSDHAGNASNCYHASEHRQVSTPSVLHKTSILEESVSMTTKAIRSSGRILQAYANSWHHQDISLEGELVAALLGLALFVVPCLGVLICMYSDGSSRKDFEQQDGVASEDSANSDEDNQQDSVEETGMLRPPRHVREAMTQCKTLPGKLPGYSWDPVLSSDSSAADISDKDRSQSEFEDKEGDGSVTKEAKKTDKKKAASYAPSKSLPASVGAPHADPDL
jgi:hypothetical protein